jgi:hypothetical protein
MESEIENAQKRVGHLIENCLSNLSVEQLEVVQERHGILLSQQMFWLSRDNSKRFLYDLKDYGIWLCDYIADAERLFWREEEI